MHDRATDACLSILGNSTKENDWWAWRNEPVQQIKSKAESQLSSLIKQLGIRIGVNVKETCIISHKIF